MRINMGELFEVTISDSGYGHSRYIMIVLTSY